MKIKVNGEERDIEALTLAALCDELGLSGTRIATAHNGEFVPEAARHSAVLIGGDAIEILSPRQGG